MYHVIFDTNALKSEHLYSPRMKTLKRLIDENLVKVYIPEIVKREFLTQKFSEYEEKLKTKNVSSVNSFFIKNKMINSKLLEAERLIKEVSADIECSVENEFNEWSTEYKITKVELADEKEYFFDISFKAKAALRFGTEYYEYMELEEDIERDVELWSMKGDGAAVVDENRYVEFYGVIGVNIKDLKSNEPNELIDYKSIHIADIDRAIILP